jgi:thioredoxin 1
MPRVFDAVLASSDLSLDRVLSAGLPVMMIFHDAEPPASLRKTMDDLARQYAGRALLVTLARRDAPQAVSRFGVRGYPGLVTARDGKTVTAQASIGAQDLKSHLAYLLGEGPRPAAPSAQSMATPKREVSSHPVSVNEADFDREVLRADRPVLVDFWAPWCAPCRMVAPALEAIARDHGSVLKVAKVNVDENPSLAGKYGAMSIPTMVVIKGGREVDRWVGALPEQAIRSRVARWIQPERRAA